MNKPILLTNAAKYYKSLPHQIKAWEELQASLERSYPDLLERFAIAYRSGPIEVLTMPQARAIFGRSPTAAQLADLNDCLRRFKIDTAPRMRHFLAQIAHESGGLQWLQELATGDDYEGRLDLGNTQPGDGRRYKGAGVIQLTGRANYQAFAIYMDDPRIMEGCQYVATRYPFTSAGFWWHNNGMNTLCDRGSSVEVITRRVNGGYNGLNDRIAYYRKACEVI